MKPQIIGIEHEALGQFKWYLDQALETVTKVMMRKGLKAGTVSAKIDIRIEEIQKQDGEIVKIMAMEPDVKVKIGSKEQFKCDKIGGLYVQTDMNGDPIVADCQISIDEYLKDQKGA